MSKPPVHFAKPYLLLCIIVLVIGAAFAYVRLLPPTLIVVNQTEKPIDKPSFSVDADKTPLKLFVFDPNTIDSAGLDSLKMPRWIKRNLLKYRSSGAVFHQKSDLRKLYGMSDSLYAQLQAYVRILPITKEKYEPHPRAVSLSKAAPPRPRALIDLNSPFAASLSIPHIVGEKRCLSIIKYRDRLGGFYSVSQLAEVYSIGDSLLPTLAGYYFADPSAINKRNLSDETWKSLVSHPYIDSYLAKHILQARKISPELLSIHQLFEAKVVDSASYSVLQYYFN